MRIFNIILSLLTIFIISCSSDSSNPKEPNPDTITVDPPSFETIVLPAYSQRIGDANKGYEYLTTGNFMSSGIPLNAYLLGFGESTSNLLNRDGDNAKVPYELNVATAPNGVKIVAPNCLQCHATKINNELIIGLGNQTIDFTVNRADEIQTLKNGIHLLYGSDSKEWEAFKTFSNSLEAAGPKTVTKSRGVNPADKTTLVLTAYRDKNTLEQLDEPNIEISDEVIPSDVPAWWLLKKKNALFYHAIAREDFSRSILTMILATMDDVEKAKEVDEKIPDILAYIYSLEAPKYPFDIDQNLANEGETLFNNNCAGCHGTYGNNETYPNLLVSLKTVGTDPTLSNFYNGNSEELQYFKDWFNSGWFGSDPHKMQFVTQDGYVAPPLDGIWATAPYFHNASVPTIEDVLNSNLRPKYWSRTFESTDYNQEKVGWNYTEKSSQIDANTYDTTLKGYGNMGHTFGDKLDQTERKAIIEYLKTL